MGAWSTGLYSSDFAKDLSGTVKGAARLPFGPDRLLELIQTTEPMAADDPQDPDHTVFWLVVADQFAKRNIDCPAARERALAIIRDGTDLAAMRALGMDEKSLLKRGAMLDELRVRIAAPLDGAKPRKTLKAPQKLLLEVGEVVIYPVCKGRPINPYAVGKDWAWVKAWKQDGWGAFVVIERGLMFDYLAWYRPMRITEPLQDEPSLAELLQPRMWVKEFPGTLTPRHYENMQFKSLGRIEIDFSRMARHFRKYASPLGCAVNDITLAEYISVRPFVPDDALRAKYADSLPPWLSGLSQIM